MELLNGVQAAACTEGVCERGLQRVLTGALVGPSHLRPLLRELPDALEIFVHSPADRIHAAMKKERPLIAPQCTFWFGWRRDIIELAPGEAWTGPGHLEGPAS